jgi:transcriptional regulator with XRE-family HTH domain
MISQEAILIQNKIIGVALRNARARAGKSIQECAVALSCPPESVTKAEEGLEGLTLPQLEVLAHVLNTPLAYMLGEQEFQDDHVQDVSLPYDNVMTIRRKIIGVILRQARLELGRTLDDIATAEGYTPEHLARVELGEEQIDLVKLRSLAKQLNIVFEDFVQKDIIPLTPAERDARDLQYLAHLPQDVREFVLKPINMPYLQVAMNLSHMPAEALRQIASGLLEITY